MNTRYAGFMPNDFINGIGVSVSYWAQGCPHQCSGCHNPETWDFNGGKPLPANIIEQLKEAITANGIQRNFSILGGEPLAEENKETVLQILQAIRESFPDITICLWTGYTLEELQNMNDPTISNILNSINVLIDGRYEQDQRDISLMLRGSRNQKIHILNNF